MPVLQTLFLTVIVLAVERGIALSAAKGKGNIATFVAKVKAASKGTTSPLLAPSAPNRKVLLPQLSTSSRSLRRNGQEHRPHKEQKIANLQKQVEEATALEMPTLQQNLPIIATMTTLGTLVGLLGTVMGMIKSFQALSQSGAPDSTELSTGISEALINTAFGIATGAFAVIFYNYYTNKIDNLTYAIDEIGFSIVQTFAATH